MLKPQKTDWTPKACFIRKVLFFQGAQVVVKCLCFCFLEFSTVNFGPQHQGTSTGPCIIVLKTSQLSTTAFAGSANMNNWAVKGGDGQGDKKILVWENKWLDKWTLGWFWTLPVGVSSYLTASSLNSHPARCHYWGLRSHKSFLMYWGGTSKIQHFFIINKYLSGLPPATLLSSFVSPPWAKNHNTILKTPINDKPFYNVKCKWQTFLQSKM